MQRFEMNGGDSMRRYSGGSVRRMRGRWQCVLRYQEDGSGDWRSVTHMTEVPCGKGDGGRRAAEEELRNWRDSLIIDEATRIVAARYEARIASASDDGEASEALAMPFVDYALAYVGGMRLGRRSGRPIEASSRYEYERLIRNQVAPLLPAGVAVCAVTADMVEAMVASLQERYSSSTTRKAFNLVRSVFAHACEHDGLRRNPCGGLRAPRPGKPRLNSLPVTEADRLARELAGMRPTRGVTAGRLALACGLREGEMAGLTVADSGLESGFLNVRQAIARATGRGRSYVKAPKTDSGLRRIPLNGEVRSALEGALSMLEDACDESGVRVSGRLFLLGHPDGTWTAPDTLGREWSAVSRALGLVGMAGRNVTLHDLRHTFATCALAKGAPVKDVQAVLGHSSAQMTLDVYASSDPERRRGAMEAIGRDV